MAKGSDQIGVGDFYTLKSDPSLKGIVERVWHDTEADPYTVKNRFLVHKDLPDHVRQKLKRTKLLPENFVVLRLLWLPSVDILVHTSDLVLIDRYFSRGDVVKRSPSDAQSGTVIGTSCSCTLRPMVSVTELQKDTSVRVDFAPKERQITDVDTQKLRPYDIWDVGDTVIFEGWVGTVEDVDCLITIQLKKDGSVVTIDDQEDITVIVPLVPRDFTYVRLSGERRKKEGHHGCYPGQRVRVKKSALAKGRWHSGTFNAANPPKGVVLSIHCTMMHVHWIMPRSNAQADTPTSKPAAFLLEEQLYSGDVKIYDFSRAPEVAPGVEDPFSGVPSMEPREFVIRRDTNISTMRYAWLGPHCERRIERSSGPPLAPDNSMWYAAEITSTASKVRVQWQDNSVTHELSAGICSYNEVDDHDVWPGEIVSLKGPETVQQDQEFERMLRTRAVGVVQSVNAVERIARIRWFKGADITVTGEDYNILVRPHSKLGKITEQITESSLYEIGSYHALTKRRGDLVRLERRPKEIPGQGGISWLGEIMDLLPNGLLLVRLGALDKVRDIKCSVLEVTTVLSADDDTTDSDSSGSDYSDEWEDDAAGSTIIEYEGSVPSEHDEQEWETDSDEYSADVHGYQDETEEIIPPARSIPGSFESIEEDPMDIDSSDEASGEQTDSQEKSPTIDSRLGPSAFEILEGSAPKLASPVPSGSHSKEWLRAVSREHKILRTSLPEGVYARTWESDMGLLRVLIIGPSGTPYAHAPFLFDITLHSRFPTEAPTAFFHSWTNGVGRVNPNLYENGKVCLSLLGTWEGDDEEEEWVPGKSTVLQIIVSLLGLVLVKEPFYNEAGFEALQGTAQSKPTSAVYSEKAFVLSRGFIAKALQSLPAGCEDIIEWLYLPSRNGSSLLRTIMGDCQRFLPQDPDTTSEEEASAHQRLNLERYHIDSPKLSKGILILLRKMIPDLEDLLRYEERLVAESQRRTGRSDQEMES
ncbi:MAG: hypothetical protein Q9221_008538 [Calogaya cf. arnoldii]